MSNNVVKFDPNRKKNSSKNSVPKNEPIKMAAEDLKNKILEVIESKQAQISRNEHILYFISVFSGIFTILTLLGLVAIFR